MGLFDFFKKKPEPLPLTLESGDVATDVLNSFMHRAEANIGAFTNEVIKAAKRYGINTGYLWHILHDPVERRDWPDMGLRRRKALAVAVGIAVWASKQPEANRRFKLPYEKMDDLNRAIVSLGVWAEDVLIPSLLKDYQVTVRKKTKKYRTFVLNFYELQGITDEEPDVLLSTMSTTVLRNSPMRVYARNVLPSIFHHLFEVY